VSFLGTIGNVIGGAVGGLVHGGPIGAVTGALGGLTGHPVPAGPTTPVGPPPFGDIFRFGGQTGAPGLLPAGQGTIPQLPVPKGTVGAQPVPGLGGIGERLLPGGASGYQLGGGLPAGYHLNKRYREYYIDTQQGKDVLDPTKTPQVRNIVVKNRRMNPLNPRALKRAVSREHAAVKLMRRAMRGTGYRITRSGYGKKTRRR